MFHGVAEVIRLRVDHRLNPVPLARVTAVLPAVWLLTIITVSISGTENKSTPVNDTNEIVCITLPSERSLGLGTNEDQQRRKKNDRYVWY